MRLLNKEELTRRVNEEGLIEGTNNILEVEFDFEISGCVFPLVVDCYIVMDAEGQQEAIEFNMISETLLESETEMIYKILNKELSC